MDYIKRSLQASIEKRLFGGKALIVTGARQVGKSTLLREIAGNSHESVLTLDCDEPDVRNSLADVNSIELKSLLGNNKIIIIDEAQRVRNIGITMKLITDKFPDKQLLVTGSSSLDLHSSLEEPLTGRKIEYNLFPISANEILLSKGLLDVKQSLDSRLIYGSYPDVINNPEDARAILTNLCNSYLYKDLLEYDKVRRPVLLEKLLVALALQVGSEVSYNEIAQTVGTDNKTVEKYIDLLEKCFVIFRLNALSRNVRTELKKSKKIFFVDNGIRNAVLQNFAPLSLRNDKGALWENYIISERRKLNNYQGNFRKMYFWRTTDRQEIDYVEECDGKFKVFEMKANPNKANTSLPKVFFANYDVSESMVVTPNNYLECISKE